MTFNCKFCCSTQQHVLLLVQRSASQLSTGSHVLPLQGKELTGILSGILQGAEGQQKVYIMPTSANIPLISSGILESWRIFNSIAYEHFNELIILLQRTVHSHKENWVSYSHCNCAVIDNLVRMHNDISPVHGMYNRNIK